MCIHRARTVAVRVLFSLLTAGWLRAGIIVAPGDPVLVVGDPDQSGGGPNPASIGGNFFSFTSPTGTSPSGSPCMVGGTVTDTNCNFLNASGDDWFNLFISITPITVAEGPVNCLDFQAAGFTGCSLLTTQGSSPADFLFTGGVGIPSGVAFGFTLIGWNADTNFSAEANVPEPGGGELLAAGLAVFLACRALKDRY